MTKYVVDKTSLLPLNMLFNCNLTIMPTQYIAHDTINYVEPRLCFTLLCQISFSNVGLNLIESF